MGPFRSLVSVHLAPRETWEGSGDGDHLICLHLLTQFALFIHIPWVFSPPNERPPPALRKKDIETVKGQI